MQNFYLVRHGETDWNVKLGRLQGHTDIPLNEKGERQAMALAPFISDLGITRVISSDLVRARKTADLMTLSQMNIESNPHLREVHLGVGEGLTWDEIQIKLGEDFRSRWGGHKDIDLDLRFPEGESRREVILRVTTCLMRYLKTHEGEKIAFVTHGFVIRSLVQHLSPHQNPLFVPNCAIVPFARHSDQTLIYQGPSTIEELMQPRLDE